MPQLHIFTEAEPREILCPRCRGDAGWRFLNEEKSLVEVVCADCGVFEVPRAEFEKSEADIAEPDATRLSTVEMGDAVLDALDKLAVRQTEPA